MSQVTFYGRSRPLEPDAVAPKVLGRKYRVMKSVRLESFRAFVPAESSDGRLKTLQNHFALLEGVSSAYISFESKEWVFMGPERSPELVDGCNALASSFEHMLGFEPFVKMFFTRGPEPLEEDGYHLICRHDPRTDR